MIDPGCLKGLSLAVCNCHDMNSISRKEQCLSRLSKYSLLNERFWQCGKYLATYPSISELR